MRRFYLAPSVALAICSLAFDAPKAATVQSLVQAGSCGDNQSGAAGSVSATCAEPNAGGFARASATADYGTIGALAAAAASPLASKATALALFDDFIVFTGAGAGAGFFSLPYDLSGSTTLEAGGQFSGAQQALVQVDFAIGGFSGQAKSVLTNDIAGGGVMRTDTTSGEALAGVLSIPFSGGSLSLDASLAVVADCGANQSDVGCLAIAEYGSTLKLFGATILDENMNPIVGASAMSDSGYNYLAAVTTVPLPASIWLLCAGMAALAARARFGGARAGRPV